MGISRRRALALTGAAVPLAVGIDAPSVTAAPAATTATGQLDWLIDASHRAPVPATEVTRHLSADLLAAIGGTDGFNTTMTRFGALTPQRTLSTTPTQVQALVTGGTTTYLATLAVDGSGLLQLLRFGPYQPSPTTWAELDSTLRQLAPRVNFVAAEIGRNGHCRLVHGVDHTTQRPLGSAFKLYVLSALGRAVATGSARWDETLAIRDDWKSLPSGELQDRPAGTELTLRQYADYMISISDNTAADHLIHRLGRAAVEAEVVRLGNSDPWASYPFLTTREVFALKGHDYPHGANRYLALPRPLRRAALPALDRVPRSDLTPWQQPRLIDRVEWFGSPTDICHAFAGLWRRSRQAGMAPLGTALSLNDSGIGFDRHDYPEVWSKGGSEPGVLTLNYLAGTPDGRALVSSVLLSDPHQPLDEAAIGVAALAVARGGIELADRH